MLEDVRYALASGSEGPGICVRRDHHAGAGIGAAAAMFVLIQGVLLSPPPYANPDRLVFLTQARLDGSPYLQGMTIGQWIDWRSSAKTMSARALPLDLRLSRPARRQPIDRRHGRDERVLQDAGRQADAGPRVSPERSEPPGAPATAASPPARCAGDRRDHWPRTVGTAVRPRSEHRRQDAADQPHAGAAADRRCDAARRSLPARPGASSEPNYDVNAAVDYFLPFDPMKRSHGRVAGMW